MEEKIIIPDIKIDLTSVSYCKQCGTRYRYWCERVNHEKISKINVPFIIPDLKITHAGSKWVRLSSAKMKKNFNLSSSKFREVVMGCGILPGGNIPDQWWIVSNVGESITLKWLGSTDGKYTPKS